MRYKDLFLNVLEIRRWDVAGVGKYMNGAQWEAQKHTHVYLDIRQMIKELHVIVQVPTIQ